MPQVPVVTPNREAIRAGRLALGLSPAQLSRKIGRGPQTVHQIEAGKQLRVSEVLIHQLANALGRDVAELIEDVAA